MNANPLDSGTEWTLQPVALNTATEVGELFRVTDCAEIYTSFQSVIVHKIPSTYGTQWEMVLHPMICFAKCHYK